MTSLLPDRRGQSQPPATTAYMPLARCQALALWQTRAKLLKVHLICIISCTTSNKRTKMWTIDVVKKIFNLKSFSSAGKRPTRFLLAGACKNSEFMFGWKPRFRPKFCWPHTLSTVQSISIDASTCMYSHLITHCGIARFLATARINLYLIVLLLSALQP